MCVFFWVGVGKRCGKNLCEDQFQSSCMCAEAVAKAAACAAISNSSKRSQFGPTQNVKCTKHMRMTYSYILNKNICLELFRYIVSLINKAITTSNDPKFAIQTCIEFNQYKQVMHSACFDIHLHPSSLQVKSLYNPAPISWMESPYPI